MDTSPIQSPKQSEALPIGRPSRGFPPGVSGHPHGRESKAARTARRERLISRWCEPYGGVSALEPAELDLLHQAAELHLRNIRARKAEDAVRIANCISKILAQVGLVNREQPREQVEVEPEPVPVPAESAREQIERGIAEAVAKRSDNADAD
jgi:hypothetical protein